MEDTRFSCPACGQPLVADRSGAGLQIDCPQCAAPVQIPFESEPDKERPDESLISELSRRVEVLDAEVSKLTAQLAASEASRIKADAAFHAAGADLIHARKLVETTKAERNQYAADLDELKAAMTQLRTELAALQEAHAEANGLIERQRIALSESENRSAALQTERDEFEKELAGTKSTLADTRMETAALRVEYGKLCTDVAQNHELADSIEIRRRSEKLEGELREALATLAQTMEKLELAQRQREALRGRSVELELKLAASREAFSESQLAQDNEILRKLVERINEELKERSPVPKKAPPDAHGFIGSMVELGRSLRPRSVEDRREV